jgi:N-acetylglucosaminyl-diphospho-decaprenol L-rhamnosyltransferase
MEKTELLISVVSHCQAGLVKNVIDDIKSNPPAIPYRIIVTINTQEDCSKLDAISNQVVFIRNSSPKGFGENHNAAFNAYQSKYFCIINPDIRLSCLNWASILAVFSDTVVGASGPCVMSPMGKIEDSARQFPTLKRLLIRKLTSRQMLEYFPCNSRPIDVDWLAGMFVVYKSAAYSAVRGFNEYYFMYVEDAEICKRLSSQGLKIKYVVNTHVTHDAQRASRRKMKYLVWHLNSLFRFLILNPLRFKSSIKEWTHNYLR